MKTAFLYGHLEEDVYINPPEGMSIESGKALKLVKGLYGLKQAPRVWSNEFKSQAGLLGFKPSLADNCVFINSDKSIFICIYVDDGLILSRDESALDDIIQKLQRVFDIRLIENSTFVGLQIERGKTGFIMHQTMFAKKIIERFGVTEGASVTSPLMPGHKLTEVDSSEEEFDCPYREAIGSLLYLAANIRPDFLHTVTMLANSVTHQRRSIGMLSTVSYVTSREQLTKESFSKHKTILRYKLRHSLMPTGRQMQLIANQSLAHLSKFQADQPSLETTNKVLWRSQRPRLNLSQQPKQLVISSG